MTPTDLLANPMLALVGATFGRSVDIVNPKDAHDLRECDSPISSWDYN